MFKKELSLKVNNVGHVFCSESLTLNRLVDINLLALEEAKEIVKSSTPEQLQFIDSSTIYNFILFDHLDLKTALSIGKKYHDKIDRLESNIHSYINSKYITLEEALNLSIQQVKFLDCWIIHNFIHENKLNFKTALALGTKYHDKLDRLKNDIVNLIILKYLTLEQALNLSPQNVENLCLLGIFNMIVTNKLSIESALTLTNEQAILLNCNENSNLISSISSYTKSCIDINKLIHNGPEYVRSLKFSDDKNWSIVGFFECQRHFIRELKKLLELGEKLKKADSMPSLDTRLRTQLNHKN